MDHQTVPVSALPEPGECSRNALTWGWAQLVSNQRPLACKDCHHHPPTCSLVVVAGFSALISRLGSTGSATGLTLLIFSSLGLGPFGAFRPWWHIALGFVAGVAWRLLLLVPGWLLSPRSAEQSAVAGVYHALADDLRAIGTDRTAGTRREVTAALNTAYDTLLTARATAGGRSRRMTHLRAVLNASSRVSEAVITLRREGTRLPPLVADILDRLADAIAAGGPLHGGSCAAARTWTARRWTCCGRSVSQ